MRASGSWLREGLAVTAGSFAVLLAATAAPAQDPGPPPERPPSVAGEQILPEARPTPPATDGETEVEIEAEAQPEEADAIAPAPDTPPEARPTPPATDGETEVEIEAEAQPDEADAIAPAPDTPPEARPEADPEADLPGPLPRPTGATSDGEPSRPDPGWTVRQAPGASPVAVGGGPGQVASVAAFCLGGSPWLALELFPAPEAASVRADFGFTETRVEAEALREDGAGGAYVIELAEGPLAGLLAGRDTVAALGLDGTQQGPLSLAGSSRAIRAALEPCHTF